MSNGSAATVQREARKYGIVLFCICMFFFGLIPYGGVRSSDSEVVFRLGESIAMRGEFYLQRDLEDWHAFGVAYGKGHKLYPIFGPLESVLLAPVIRVADLINETGWYESMVPMLPLSHFSEKGWYQYLNHEVTTTPQPHALRLLCSIFNVIVTALGVFVFWRILLLLTKSIASSFLVSLIYALGTHAWAYAGTFFSEPLATLLVLLSFLSLLKSDDLDAGLPRNAAYRPVFLSGIWMGLAVTAHITAALFAPFFALYFFWKQHGSAPTFWSRLERASVFSLGVFILLFVLGWYNYFRFGSFFETGRTVSAISGEIFGYGSFVLPFLGLYGLVFGAGKGIVFYMPVLVVGALLWRSFFKADRKLFTIVLWALAFRILFIASRSDWHGGFCIGPRYLIMAIPFFLIPLAFWLRDREHSRFARAFGLVSAGAVFFSIEQFYFGLSEIFTFLQVSKFREQIAGVNVFANDRLYLDWKYSPLLNFDKMRISPFLLRYTGLSFGQLMEVGALVLLVIFSLWYFLLRKMPRSLSASSRQ